MTSEAARVRKPDCEESNVVDEFQIWVLSWATLASAEVTVGGFWTRDVLTCMSNKEPVTVVAIVSRLFSIMLSRRSTQSTRHESTQFCHEFQSIILVASRSQG